MMQRSQGRIRRILGHSISVCGHIDIWGNGTSPESKATEVLLLIAYAVFLRGDSKGELPMLLKFDECAALLLSIPNLLFPISTLQQVKGIIVGRRMQGVGHGNGE